MRPGYILTINGGSSSVKFALFNPEDLAQWKLAGKIERIGLSDPLLSFHDKSKATTSQQSVVANDFESAVRTLVDWLESKIGLSQVAAVGHRVVHGGTQYRRTTLVTPQMMQDLRRISGFAPEHLPFEIRLMEVFRQRQPKIVQVACFDTAFHADLPRVARILPIPRKYFDKGIQRYGFHGLSYQYLMEELTSIAGAKAAKGRIILAHFGNGASLAAVREGRCMDTSMGFTPTAGLPMSTRSGDLDPGLVCFLAQTEDMTAQDFLDMANHESGLLGVSETSSDVRDLLSRQDRDPRAADAVALFCYQARKWIGALTAALGGLDTLIFSGGIGENAPMIRERICRKLEFLGIQLDKKNNQTNAPILTTSESPVVVRMIKTNEERILARNTRRILTQVENP